MRLLTLFFSLVAASSVFSQQHQIDWGTSAVTDKVITSDGSMIDLADFSIELGGFGNGFTPNASNVTQWVANWQVFDAVTDPDTDTSGPKGERADGFETGLGVTDARFVGTGFLQGDQTSGSEDANLDVNGNPTDTFGPNQQAYVFIRNSDAIGEDAEWLLYTSSLGNDWEFPSVVGGQPTTPDSWFLGEADTAHWGGVNGTIEGGGEHTDTSTDFILRTHTFIPEPSSVFLILLASLSLLRRRR